MKQKNLHCCVIILFFLTFNFTFAQKTISGNVSDESGVPLPGVNVVIKGTETGTSTDFDGNYSISASEGLSFEPQYSLTKNNSLYVIPFLGTKRSGCQ